MITAIYFDYHLKVIRSNTAKQRIRHVCKYGTHERGKKRENIKTLAQGQELITECKLSRDRCNNDEQVGK